MLAATSDYLDGIAARVTGQYSRLGALMDPLIDRLVVIAGVVVVWHFELLPRWALAVLIAREVFMLVAVLAALRAGLDLHINWIGRIAVWPTMSAVGSALFGWDTARRGVPLPRPRRLDRGDGAVRDRRAAGAAGEGLLRY